MLEAKDIKSIMQEILLKKKSMLSMRIKKSSGDLDAAKNMKNTKKEVARLFTKLNAK